MALNGPYHLVQPSPWPLMGSCGAFVLACGFVFWFHMEGHPMAGLGFGFTIIVCTMYQWWRDIVREATFMGYHTKRVVEGLRYGMVMFIVSEAMFFFSFFWAFFHSSLAPAVECGCVWPPVGIEPIEPFGMPFLNTVVLLSSGVAVTYAHYSLVEGDLRGCLEGLGWSIFLGCCFTKLQLSEYKIAPFAMTDGIYGSTFYVTTGFHGLHVIIGTVFLSVGLMRAYWNHFSSGHHFGLEAAIWYWHFVDVVWILLFLCFYWWGS